MHIQLKLFWQQKLNRFVDVYEQKTPMTKNISITVISENEIAKESIEIPQTIKYISIDRDGSICGFVGEPKPNDNIVDLSSWEQSKGNMEFIDIATIRCSKPIIIKNWKNCMIELDSNNDASFIIVKG